MIPISRSDLRRCSLVVATLLGGGGLIWPHSLGAATAPGSTRVSFPHSIAEIATVSTQSASPGQPVRIRAFLKPGESAADMNFEVALRMHNFTGLQERLERSERIPPSELAASYLPSATDYARVASWIRDQGFTITRTDANRLAVFARGSVALVQEKLEVSFARVAVDGVEYTAAVTAPTLPAEIAPAVLGIHGLQTHLRHRRLASALPFATAGSAPPYYPAQINTAYNAAGALGLTGRGQTIAVVAATTPDLGDLATFWRVTNITDSVAQIQTMTVGAGAVANPSTGLIAETNLDIQWTSALAPNAKIRVYIFDDTDPTAFDAVYQQIYADLPTNPGLHQLSISYGLGESDLDRDYLLISSQYSALLVNAGVTIFAAAGDTADKIHSKQQVSFPASDPNVTGVGGTSLMLDSNANVMSETAWSGSGGGSSAFFTRPAWQVGAGLVVAGNGNNPRQVPDVAAIGDPITGAAFIFGGKTFQIGGTSLATPVWSAFCAQINEARANAGQPPLGLLNARIYPLLLTSALRDITVGSAGANSATVGYDPCTGIGAPNVAALIGALSNLTLAPAIMAQLTNQLTTPGQNAAFAVVAQGTAPLTFQWQRQPASAATWSNVTDSSSYVGSSTATLLVTGATYAMNGDSFRCVVTNSAGTATSNPGSVLLVNPSGVTTVAGWPYIVGFADGVGRSARFNYPGGVRVDGQGNLFVSDAVNCTVRKITPAGVVTTVAGQHGVSGSTDGPAATALFNNPGGVAPDAFGNIYVADSANYTVRKISPTGVVSTLAGSPGVRGSVDGTGASARLFDPQNITADAVGNVYVADGIGETVRKITPAGVVTTLAGSAGVSGFADGLPSAARFNLLGGIAVDTAGNVYVADSLNNRIRKIVPSGQVSTIAGDGVAGSTDSGPGFPAGRVNVPGGVTVDAAGNVYVADTFNSAIRQITPAGVMTTIAGTPGFSEARDGPTQTAVANGSTLLPPGQFNYPADVAVDSAGVIYVADALNNTVRRIVRGALVPPALGTSAASQHISASQSATFSVTATGSVPLTYQWSMRNPGAGLAPADLQDNATYQGTTTATLTVVNASATMSGSIFYCTVRNNLGAVVSSDAPLLVDGLSAASLPAPSVAAGASVTLPAGAGANATSTTQWQLNGGNLPGGNSGSLTVGSFQPANAGIYTPLVTNAAGITTAGDPFVLGLSSLSKVIGSGAEVGPNISHPNGNVYDQVLLQGAAATVTADPGQVTRISYIDLTDDIVQVEFGGAGTLSLVLDNPSGPAAPLNYNQANVTYMKGHAGIVITGADDTTNVSAFSVGTLTAVNQALFKSGVTYDGMADLAFIAICSTNGKFGGVRTANASYYAAKGYTGIYAPGVQFTGPVYAGDLNASGTATPVLLLGSATNNTWITGGDLLQLNGQPVKVSGLTQLKFAAGSTSHGVADLPAQKNKAVLQQNGADVTAQIVVNPVP